MKAPEIAAAKREAELARQRLLGTASELQQRLKPGTIASNAWEGVKDKGSTLAGDAAEAVKARPAVASAAVAAVTLFLAREPIRSGLSWLFAGKPDEDLVTTRLAASDEHYDLTAPLAVRAESEGASA